MQLRFDDHVLDVARRELRRCGQLIALEPQVFDLLVYLVHNHDRVVTKDDLLNAVWSGRIVSESTLNSRINGARKAIGDSGDTQCLIRTVPRKGFRFVGKVTDEQPEEPSQPPLVQKGRASIAVLAFDNMSDDREQEYFADGMVEEIITGLSRIKWLLVISRNSSFIYKGRPTDVRTIGRELGVRYVLEGSVRRAGDHVRVAGQLIETATATHIWADRYNGTLGDIFTLQDEITMSVIGAVEPTLRKAEIERVRRKRPDSLDAYDLYLRALPFATTSIPGDAEIALPLLQQAIALGPHYAAAHGFIALCQEGRYLRGGERQAEVREAALIHARAAITYGSDDATALATGGFVFAELEQNYDVALDALDRALALSPSSALAFGFSSAVRAWMGDTETAIAHGRSGIRLGPFDPMIYVPYLGLAYAYCFTKNWAEAAIAASRAAEANPGLYIPLQLLTVALTRLGRLKEAAAMSMRLLALEPVFTLSRLRASGVTTPERLDILVEALREAGLPE